MTEPEAHTAPEKPRRPLRTQDIRCLECGVYNIPDNLVCGACGANLPLVYDREGKVFHWETDSPYWDALHPKKKGLLPRGAASGWILRTAVVLGALAFALYLMARRQP